MYEIIPGSVAGYNDLVGVTTSNEMTPELQKIYCENTAFQGFMWTPFLNAARRPPAEEETVGSTDYIFAKYQVLLPAAELDIYVKALPTRAGGYVSFEALMLRGDAEIPGAEAFYGALSDAEVFNEGNIMQVPKGDQFATLYLRTALAIQLPAFTAFYRIRG